MLAVIDGRSPLQLERALLEKGYEVCRLPAFPLLASPVRSHPDMLLFFSENAVFTHHDYYLIAKEEIDGIAAHVKKRICFTDTAPSALYPNDVSLNACPIGDRLFCNVKTVNPTLLSLYPHQKQIRVKQGYTKCSVLPLSKNALITEDPSIADAAQKNGVERLLLSAKEVRIEGYDVGFIGGASSYAPYKDLDNILFCGDWRLHTQADEILSFCLHHGKQPVSLLPYVELLDVGTIFLI